MMKKILLGCLLLGGQQMVFAQDQQVPAAKRELYKLPVPPTPNAAALGKFGDIPVGLATGIPSITVPIYDYKDVAKKLDFSINLRYHAGGYKVEDMASNCGLGWALDAGGMISRTLNGLPDDQSGGYLTTNPLPIVDTHPPEYYYYVYSNLFPSPYITEGVAVTNDPIKFWLLDGIERRNIDGEADVFNISAPGISAKFVFTKDRVAHLITQQNLTITFNGILTGNASRIYGFTIVDNNTGITYIFSVPETQTPGVMGPMPGPGGASLAEYVTNWHLKNMISADKKDTINWNYENIQTNQEYEAGYSESYTINTYNFLGTSQRGEKNAFILVNNNPLRLKSIELPDKTLVDFSYQFARQDLTRDFALSQINISNGDRKKSFNLSYDYFDCLCSDGNCITKIPVDRPNDFSKRLKLLRVQQTDGIGNSLPPYEFTYNTQPLPSRSSTAQDYWGYYNGKESGSLIPQIYIYRNSQPGGHIGGAQRDADPYYGKAGIMEMIKYPTGGYTKLYFEGNSVFNEDLFWDKSTETVEMSKKDENSFKPMLFPDRNVSITTAIPVTFKSSTNFLLSTDNTGNQVPTGGNIYMTIRSTDLSFNQTFMLPVETLDNTQESLTLPAGKNYEVKFTADYFVDLLPDYDLRVAYTYNINPKPRSVGGLRIAKLEDYPNNGNDPVVTRYDYSSDTKPTSGEIQNIPNYTYYSTTVNVWDGAGDNGSLPTCHPEFYLNFTSTPTQSLSYFQGSPVIYTKVKVTKGQSGKMLGYSVHEFTSFAEIHAGNFDYPYEKEQQLEWKEGLPTKSYVYDKDDVLQNYEENIYTYDGYTNSTDNGRNLKTITRQTDNLNTLQNLIYGGRPYYWSFGHANLTKKIRRDYANGQTMEQVTDYTYYPETYLPATVQHPNSKGQLEETRYYYVPNYNASALPANIALYNGHALVSQENWLQQTGAWYLKGATVNSFGTFGNVVLPAQIGIAQLASPMPAATAGSFDPNQVKRIPGLSQDVNFRSYDNFGHVNEVLATGAPLTAMIWSAEKKYPVATVANAAINEVYYNSFEDAGGVADANAFSGAKSASGSFTIPFTLPPGTTKTFKLSYWTSNGTQWTLQTQSYTGPITITGTRIDEVRIYPVDAQMTSYTYDPMLGVTSKVDNRDIVTYYEYDSFLRLLLIRDYQRNVIKKFEYYYGTPPPPIVVYKSQAKSGTFSKNNCASGFAGSTVTYIVPAEKYTSTISQLDADQKAQNDVNNNGQAYANSTGKCVSNGCNVSNCVGVNKRCVNGNCETGMKIYTNSVYNPSTMRYDCTYHYEFSDGSWSVDYVEDSFGECMF
ncbi:DUF5977 domain-containing protein [Chitinophaga sp. Hz27]|uniref:DUF5977 domain-containing protein n=1 Tax=Chitinophaga sp. Hz27 TaxID=3347169 RepID=UPI0035DD26C5